MDAASADAGYEVLEHTADLGIQAWGAAEPEAFEEAARALAEIMGVWLPGHGTRRVVRASAGDLAAVLVAFLNELLWLHETGSVGFAEVDVIAVSDTSIVAEVEVLPLPEGPPDGIAVKAATYHQLAVDRRPGEGVQLRVFLDV